MQRVGFGVLAVYLFLLFSRAPELVAARLGTSFYQVFIASIGCAVMTVVTGSLASIVGSRISMVLLGLHAWYLLSVPFSYWRTGSIEYLTYVARYAPLVFFIMALIRTEKQLRSAFGSMRLAMLVALLQISSQPIVESNDNRLQVETGRFTNSNEIALYLLIGLPFWVHMAFSKRYKVPLRLLAIFEIAASLYQCLRTGSRAGLITILILGVVLFLISSPLNKLKIFVLAVALSLAALPLLPTSVRDRLASVFGGAQDLSAEDSTASRMALLMQSIELTAKHPVLGVGIGVFTAAAANFSEEKGTRKLWQVSHNAYGQVSSEAGIPALLLFLTTLGMSIRAAWRSIQMARRVPGMEDLMLLSGCVLLVFIVYCFNCFFANLAQELFYYMAIGFAFATHRVVSERYWAFQRAAEVTRLRDLEQPQTVPDPAVPQRPPAAAPVIGRPKPVAPEEQYGGAPWARNPRRT